MKDEREGERERVKKSGIGALASHMANTGKRASESFSLTGKSDYTVPLLSLCVHLSPLSLTLVVHSLSLFLCGM